MSERKSSSPQKSVQGAGRGLRPSATDLGKSKEGTEAEIRALMKQAKGPSTEVNDNNRRYS